jgi:hypothetical protein
MSLGSINLGGGASTPESGIINPSESSEWRRIAFTHLADLASGTEPESIWLPLVSGGSAGYLAAGADNEHPGVWQIGNGGSAGQRGLIYNRSWDYFTIGAQPFVFSFLFRLPIIPDATNDYIIALGFLDTIFASVNDCCALMVDRSVDATNFSVKVGDGTYTTTPSETAVALDTNWHLGQVYITSTSQQIYLDGSLYHDEPTNFAAGGVDMQIQGDWVAGAARVVYVDWLAADIKLAASQPSWFDITTL